ncbi:MAG: phosphatase PAP2 family protein [Acidimicrobiales bacterium]
MTPIPPTAAFGSADDDRGEAAGAAERADDCGLRGIVREFDSEVDDLFERLRGNRFADRIFYSASAFGDFGLVWVALALVRALRGRPRDERAAIRAIVATGIESVVVNAGMKSLFGRRRPVREVEHPLPFRTPITSSFPSGHATAAFCAAVLLSDDDTRARATAYYAIAALVAASRVHVRIHHGSDVLAGVAVGIALGEIGKRVSPLARRSPNL